MMPRPAPHKRQLLENQLHLEFRRKGSMSVMRFYVNRLLALLGHRLNRGREAMHLPGAR